VTDAGLGGGLLPHAERSNATLSAIAECRPRILTRASPIVRRSIATRRAAAS